MLLQIFAPFVIALAQPAQAGQVQIALLVLFLCISNLPQNSAFQHATQTNINLQLRLHFA